MNSRMSGFCYFIAGSRNQQMPLPRTACSPRMDSIAFRCFIRFFIRSKSPFTVQDQSPPVGHMQDAPGESADAVAPDGVFAQNGKDVHNALHQFLHKTKLLSGGQGIVPSPVGLCIVLQQLLFDLSLRNSTGIERICCSTSGRIKPHLQAMQQHVVDGEDSSLVL